MRAWAWAWVGWVAVAGCGGSHAGGSTGASGSGSGESSGDVGGGSSGSTGDPSTSGAPTTTGSETGATSSGGATTGSPTTDATSSSTTGGATGTTGAVDPGGPIFVENPGFEADAVAPGDYNDMIVPAGWSAYDPEGILGLDYNSLGVLNPTGSVLYPDGAPEGNNVALVFLWRMQTNDKPAGYVQELAATLEPDTEYTLKVAVGNIAPEVNVMYDLGGFPGYRVELLAGGQVLAADEDTLAPGEGQFLTSACVFTSGADHPALGMPLAIRLINLNLGGKGIEVNFDDVALHAAPAP